MIPEAWQDNDSLSESKKVREEGKEGGREGNRREGKVAPCSRLRQHTDVSPAPAFTVTVVTTITTVNTLAIVTVIITTTTTLQLGVYK